MAFEDLKERLVSEFKSQWEQFQDSSLYILAKERYENFTPIQQKLSLVGIALFFTYLLLSLPLSFYSSSSEHVAEFEGKRQLIRDILKVSKETSEGPNLPVPPDVASLKSQIDAELQNARLLPEQIKGTEETSEKVKLDTKNLFQGAVKVTLAQLNLRQIIDLGHKFQSINPSVKMTDLQMVANAKDGRYFDVVYKLAVLNVPSPVEEADEPEPPPKRRGK
ncbi:MAG: hypothetical protein ACAH59_04865 [Pseudobdellovibrionaceae bacterium]